MTRDRIKELRRIPASELKADPRNWRRHPERQAKILQGLLAEIGYADALLARETDEGLVLIDGHLRAETTPDQEVPVLILDVDETEAGKIIATLDPLSSMAEVDKDALRNLVASIEFEDERAKDMLRTLEKDIAKVLAPQNNPGEIDGSDYVSKWEIVVECEDEAAQEALYNQLTEQGLRCRALKL